MTWYWLLSLVPWLIVTPSNGATTSRNPQDIVSLSTLIYTAEHDITKLGVIFDESKQLNKQTIFLIETETKGEERIDSLYVLKNGVKTKLLDNASDIAVVNLAEAYFGAKDGIYIYNKEENTAKKYGSLSDEVISIAVQNGTGTLYYLNKQKQLYKLTEDGEKSTIVEAVKNAEEIVNDHSGHLYYYLSDKSFYIYDGNIRRIEGIPRDLNKVWFVRTPVIIQDCAIFNGDDQYYAILSGNATVAPFGQPQQRQTAMSADTGFVMYFAKDKKIYEFNILGIVFEGVLEALAEGFRNMAQDLRKMFSLDTYLNHTYQRGQIQV